MNVSQEQGALGAFPYQTVTSGRRHGTPSWRGHADAEGLRSHSPDRRAGVGLSCSQLSQQSGSVSSPLPPHAHLLVILRPVDVPRIALLALSEALPNSPRMSREVRCNLSALSLFHGDSRVCPRLTPLGDLPHTHSPFGPFKIGPEGGVVLSPPSVTSSTGSGEYAATAVGEPRFGRGRRRHGLGNRLECAGSLPHYRSG